MSQTKKITQEKVQVYTGEMKLQLTFSSARDTKNLSKCTISPFSLQKVWVLLAGAESCPVPIINVFNPHNKFKAIEYHNINAFMFVSDSSKTTPMMITHGEF